MSATEFLSILATDFREFCQTWKKDRDKIKGWGKTLDFITGATSESGSLQVELSEPGDYTIRSGALCDERVL